MVTEWPVAIIIGGLAGAIRVRWGIDWIRRWIWSVDRRLISVPAPVRFSRSTVIGPLAWLLVLIQGYIPVWVTAEIPVVHEIPVIQWLALVTFLGVTRLPIPQRTGRRESVVMAIGIMGGIFGPLMAIACACLMLIGFLMINRAARAVVVVLGGFVMLAVILNFPLARTVVLATLTAGMCVIFRNGLMTTGGFRDGLFDIIQQLRRL